MDVQRVPTLIVKSWLSGDFRRSISSGTEKTSAKSCVTLPWAAMSALIANKLLPWKRYWVPWNGRVHSGWDGTGFVTKPEGLFGRSFNPDLHIVDDILDRPFLVLSGQPGIGKTQEVEQLKAKWSKVAPLERLLALEARILGGDVSSVRATT